jgi:MFS family permease
MAVSLLGDSMLYAVLPAKAVSLGLPLALVGVLLSVNRWVRLLTNLGAAAVFRRWGIRRGLIAGSLLTIASTTSYGLFPSFAAMLPARVAWGAAFSLIRLGAYSAVLHESAGHRRGRNMGLYQSISRLGSTVAVLLGGILVELIGFRWTAIGFGLVGFAGLASGAAAGRRLDLQVNLPAVEPVSTRVRLRWPSWDAALRINLATLVSAFAGYGVVVSTVGLLLFQTYGDDVPIGNVVIGVAAVSGALLAVRFGADIVLSPLFGHLSDRRGRRTVALLSGGVTLGGLLVLAKLEGFAGIALGSAAVFVASSALQVTLEAWAADHAHGGTWTSVMSRFATYRDAGSALGPLLALPLAGAVGLGPVYLGVAAALAVALAVLPRHVRAGPEL